MPRMWTSTGRSLAPARSVLVGIWIYVVNAAPMREVDVWLDRFRGFWAPKLAALATEVARGKRRRSVRSRVPLLAK
jgi:hypothetical protein